MKRSFLNWLVTSMIIGFVIPAGFLTAERLVNADQSYLLNRYRRSAARYLESLVQGQYGRSRDQFPSGGTPRSGLLLQSLARRPSARLSRQARRRKSRARILSPCRPGRGFAWRACCYAAGG